jgi:NAD(P)-dependent dehydrogenase (short-subunit alcohol dehydrogenase family)
MAGLVEGKVALVTGAGSGIGRATALAFAREGARVVVADVSVEGGEATVRAIEAAGGKATFRRADVTKEDEVQGLIAFSLETYGALHCAHNNAGIEGPRVQLAAYEEEGFDRVIAVNLKGVWLCMKYEILHMLGAGGGAIVNTSSAAGLIGSSNMPVYSASKHGVIGLTKSAAVGYAGRGIRINAVCPGLIATPMLDRMEAERPGASAAAERTIPNRRLGTAEEVAESVVWLCSDRASLVTGHALAVDGGIVAQ